MNIQRLKVNLQPGIQIFHPGSVFRWMPLDRKCSIFGQGNSTHLCVLTDKANRKVFNTFNNKSAKLNNFKNFAPIDKVRLTSQPPYCYKCEVQKIGPPCFLSP